MVRAKRSASRWRLMLEASLSISSSHSSPAETLSRRETRREFWERLFSAFHSATRRLCGGRVASPLETDAQGCLDLSRVVQGRGDLTEAAVELIHLRIGKHGVVECIQGFAADLHFGAFFIQAPALSHRKIHVAKRLSAQIAEAERPRTIVVRRPRGAGAREAG